jgi:hypothetical protein
VAEVDVQYHLGPQLADIDAGRPDDQRRIGRLLRLLGFWRVVGCRLLRFGWWRSCGGFVGRVRFVVDRLAGLLGFGGWMLFVAELPQQLQCQGWLGQDADCFGSADVG